jgi:hypothetical protein
MDASDRRGPRLKELGARIARHWSAACWFAAIVKATPGGTEPTEAGVARHPPHWLIGLWAPVAAPPLPRLPAVAAIASPGLENAAAQLLLHLPADAPLVMIPPPAADGALLARVVLDADRNLSAWLRGELERFVAAETTRLRATIHHVYTDRDPDFEHWLGALRAQGSR